MVSTQDLSQSAYWALFVYYLLDVDKQEVAQTVVGSRGQAGDMH